MQKKFTQNTFNLTTQPIYNLNMKKIQKQLSLAIAACVVIGGLESCGRAEGNFQGREYMPDMAHTVTYEGYTYGYYHNNRWGGEENYRQFYKDKIQNAKPLPGTI